MTLHNPAMPNLLTHNVCLWDVCKFREDVSHSPDLHFPACLIQHGPVRNVVLVTGKVRREVKGLLELLLLLLLLLLQHFSGIFDRFVKE